MIMNSFCRMIDQQNGWTASNYMFKFNNRNSRTRCEICSKSTIKTPDWCPWRCSGVFIVNFKQVNACRVISSWNHCWGLSLSQTSDAPWPGVEIVKKISLDFGEWFCAVVIFNSIFSISFGENQHGEKITLTFRSSSRNHFLGVNK